MEPGPSFLWDWTWVSKNWVHGFYWQSHVTCYVEPACTAVCIACHGSQDSASLYCTKFSTYLILSRLWNSCIQFLNSMQPLGMPQVSWEAWESKLFISANESRYMQWIFKNCYGQSWSQFFWTLSTWWPDRDGEDRAMSKVIIFSGGGARGTFWHTEQIFLVLKLKTLSPFNFSYYQNVNQIL